MVINSHGCCALFSFEYGVSIRWYNTNGNLLNWFTWIVEAGPDSSNWMTSQARSGVKMEVGHLNPPCFSSVCCNVSLLLISGNVWLDTNILKVHPKECNIKKITNQTIHPGVELFTQIVCVLSHFSWLWSKWPFSNLKKNTIDVHVLFIMWKLPIWL